MNADNYITLFGIIVNIKIFNPQKGNQSKTINFITNRYAIKQTKGF